MSMNMNKYVRMHEHEHVHDLVNEHGHKYDHGPALLHKHENRHGHRHGHPDAGIVSVYGLLYLWGLAQNRIPNSIHSREQMNCKVA
jgi:hypothetical protein